MRSQNGKQTIPMVLVAEARAKPHCRLQTRGECRVRHRQTPRLVSCACAPVSSEPCCEASERDGQQWLTAPVQLNTLAQEVDLVGEWQPLEKLAAVSKNT
jgi:hypothetical protein